MVTSTVPAPSLVSLMLTSPYMELTPSSADRWFSIGTARYLRVQISGTQPLPRLSSMLHSEWDLLAMFT